MVYMVFREDRDRMVGLVTFVNVDGEREERAYSASELERSWSTLSQSMLTKAPTYLAPFSARWGNDERRLENGAEVTSVKVDEATTDVYYTDEMGGGMVVSRYEAGQPWPTWTTSGNVDVRMLSAADVDELRFTVDAVAARPENSHFDYREALRTSIDIDAALKIDLEAFAQGDVEAEVAQEYKPWAGSWWSLRKGLLVWGYGSRPTFSGEIKDQVDPIKKEMDELSEKLRKMEDDDEERESTIETYREKQSELVEILKEFYNASSPISMQVRSSSRTERSPRLPSLPLRARMRTPRMPRHRMRAGATSSTSSHRWTSTPSLSTSRATPTRTRSSSRLGDLEFCNPRARAGGDTATAGPLQPSRPTSPVSRSPSTRATSRSSSPP